MHLAKQVKFSVGHLYQLTTTAAPWPPPPYVCISQGDYFISNPAIYQKRRNFNLKKHTFYD